MHSGVTFWNADFLADTADTDDIQPLRVDEVGWLWKYSDLGGDHFIQLQSSDQCSRQIAKLLSGFVMGQSAVAKAVVPVNAVIFSWND